MDALPTGTVTFLFTDIEGSTQRWERHPREMPGALRCHDEIVRAAIVANDGHVFKAIGDGFCASFKTASAAVAAAADAQRVLAAQDWSSVDGLFMRVAVHTGTADERGGDYFGPALNRVSRLLGVAHGEQVLVSAATAVLVRDALRKDESLLYLGRYRLTDLSDAEPVHQLLFSGGRLEFSPLVVGEAAPHNLPQQLTSYFDPGRRVDDIVERLQRTRLVTLFGAGGVGKTRTALEAAWKTFPKWRDGAWFVQLEQASDSDTLVRTVASVLGVRDVAGLPTADTLVHYLARRRLLLVLDNCEQVIEALAEFVGKVLARCSEITVLATSREPLHIAGERVFPIEPLDVPALESGRLLTLEQLAQWPAVALFVDRARSVEPSFRFGEEHRLPIQRICSRLDGIPLAIELAAARVGAFPPKILAERLENRFRILASGNRDDVPHHRTLHALVDWSYSLLGEKERLLFRRLAIFAGGWTLDAAEFVTAQDDLDGMDLFDTLDGLCKKSLVQSDIGEAVRFRFLETIRAFASEKLDASLERKAIESRHVAYFAEAARQVEPDLRSGAQRKCLGAMAIDVDNYRAALDASENRSDLGEAHVAICAGLSRAWLLTGAFAEGRARLHRLSTGAGIERATYCRALVGAALIALNERDAAATQYARRAVAAAAGCSDEWTCAYVVAIDTFVYFFAHLFQKLEPPAVVPGSPTIEEARTRVGSVADDWLSCYVELAAAVRDRAHADSSSAAACEERALVCARRCGDPFLIATSAFFVAYRLERIDPRRSAELLEETVGSVEPRNALLVATCAECAVRLAVGAAAYSEAAYLIGAAAAFRSIAAVAAWRRDPNEYRAAVVSALGAERFEALLDSGKDASPQATLSAIRGMIARTWPRGARNQVLRP